LYPCTDTVAAHSLLLVGQAEPALAQAIQAFLADTDRLATDLAADRCRLSDSDNRELIRRCVVLALLESVFRSGMYTYLLPVPEQLINLVSDVVVADVEALSARRRRSSSRWPDLSEPGRCPTWPTRRSPAVWRSAARTPTW